jgi:hypothetical protein
MPFTFAKTMTTEVRAENIERRRQKAKRQVERRKAKASGKRDTDPDILSEVFDAFHTGKSTELEFHVALRDRLGYSQLFIDRHAQEWRELLR